jgi:hypothetical protein
VKKNISTHFQFILVKYTEQVVRYELVKASQKILHFVFDGGSQVILCQAVQIAMLVAVGHLEV